MSQHATRTVSVQRLPSTTTVNRQGAKSAKERSGVIETREPEVKTDELAHAVIGAAIEVHRHLGPDFLEDVYEKALCLELRLRQTDSVREAEASEGGLQGAVRGRGEPGPAGRLVVELKAARAVTPIDLAKVISYLKTTKLDPLHGSPGERGPAKAPGRRGTS